jgi:hypothetical protein
LIASEDSVDPAQALQTSAKMASNEMQFASLI